MDFEKTLEGIQRWEVFFRTGKDALEDGDFEEAEMQLSRALKSAAKYGDNDPRLASINSALAELHVQQNNYEKAADHYSRVIGIW